MPYASCLAYLGVVAIAMLCQLVPLDCGSACPKFWTSAASFLQCIFAMHFGIDCLGVCILG